MAVLSNTVWIVPNLEMMLEGLFVSVLIALIGAVGYVYFVYSMRDDRADHIRKKIENSNPWERMSAENSNPKPKKYLPKPFRIIIISLIIANIILGALLLLF